MEWILHTHSESKDHEDEQPPKVIIEISVGENIVKILPYCY
jgi:hypothetical protein